MRGRGVEVSKTLFYYETPLKNVYKYIEHIFERTKRSNEQMLSKELLEKTVAEAIDITRNQYAKSDTVYKMELEKLEKLLKEYENLPLEKEVRNKIDAYIQSLEKLDGRYADLSYLAGIRDACFWAAKIGLLGIDLEKR